MPSVDRERSSLSRTRFGAILALFLLFAVPAQARNAKNYDLVNRLKLELFGELGGEDHLYSKRGRSSSGKRCEISVYQWGEGISIRIQDLSAKRFRTIAFEVQESSAISRDLWLERVEGDPVRTLNGEVVHYFETSTDLNCAWTRLELLYEPNPEGGRPRLVGAWAQEIKSEDGVTFDPSKKDRLDCILSKSKNFI